METRTCGKCGLEKPVSEFYKHAKWKYQSYCKSCKKLYRNENIEKSRAYGRNYNYKIGKCRPLGTSKECASYLGVYIAERVLSGFFARVKRMPMCNPGYDFICGKGFKIDVKSSTLRPTEYNDMWNYHIGKNKVPDYFLCIGFDNRENLTPMHVWLIPGSVINDHSGMGIMNSAIGLSRFSKYERPLERVVSCCDKARKHVKCDVGP